MTAIALLLAMSISAQARDTDRDGLKDRRDRCPEVPEDVDGFEDEDGCPELDNDLDGLPDASDACPGRPEDFDGWQDEDGCPEPGRDPARGPQEHELFAAYAALAEAVGTHLAGCDAFAAEVDEWLDAHGAAFAEHRRQWRDEVAGLPPGGARALRLEMAERAYEEELTSVSLTCTGHEAAMASWDRLYELLPPRE